MAKEKERQEELAKQAVKQAATSSLGVMPDSDFLLSLLNSFNLF